MPWKQLNIQCYDIFIYGSLVGWVILAENRNELSFLNFNFCYPKLSLAFVSFFVFVFVFVFLMSQLSTTFSETIIKVEKGEVMKDNTEKNIEEDIFTDGSEERFYSEGDARYGNVQCVVQLEILTEIKIYLYNVRIRTFSNILYVIRSQIPIMV